MTRKPVPDILGEPMNEIDIVSATFGPPVVQVLAYDYSRLDPETRIIVQQRTSEILTIKRRAEQDVIEIGVRLLDVKNRLDYGQFGAWLTAEFDWSQDVAGRFMNIARQFSQIPRIAESASYSALGMLAAPSVPEAARNEAKAIIETGERITVPKAREIIEQYRAPAGPTPQALAAVRGWLFKHVPVSQRTRVLRQYRTPPYCNTLKLYTNGIAPEQIKSAVNWIIANPDQIGEPEPDGDTPRPAPALTATAPLPSRNGHSSPSRATPRREPDDETPRPPAAPRFQVLDETTADEIANVAEGQCVDAVSIDEAGRVLLGLRNGFAIQFAAVTDNGRPALAWRIA